MLPNLGLGAVLPDSCGTAPGAPGLPEALDLRGESAQKLLTSPAEDSSDEKQTISVFIRVMKGERKNKNLTSLPDI